MYYGYGFDVTYLLVIIGMILCMAAQAKVRSTFSRYSSVPAYSGMTGAEVARRILQQNGIYDVTVSRVSGSLTDHYGSSSKTLRLSEPVYGQRSISAISVAAHECGHAIQDQENYAPLRIRASLVPVANFGAQAAWPLIILGMFLGWNHMLIEIGIILFTAVVLFHFVTLPVELNASARALRILESSGMLHGEENGYAKKVLGAAALTYIASAASMALQLIRLMLLNRRRR